MKFVFLEPVLGHGSQSPLDEGAPNLTGRLIRLYFLYVHYQHHSKHILTFSIFILIFLDFISEITTF